jgi:hypothetical protein
MKRLNRQKGMYALLIAVAALIGVTIYGSCSADEDYDGYSSRDELFSLADGEMNLRTEPQGTVWFYGDSISAGHCRVCSLTLYSIPNTHYNMSANEDYNVELNIDWTSGWTGNIKGPHSTPYFHLWECEPKYVDSLVYNYSSGKWFNYKHTFTQTDIVGDWSAPGKLSVTIKYWCHISKYYYSTDGIDHPAPNNSNDHYEPWRLINFHKTFNYSELLNDTIICR